MPYYYLHDDFLFNRYQQNEMLVFIFISFDFFSIYAFPRRK